MLTPYPQIVEYNEAVQNPQTAFRDPELRPGRVKTNALGLPVVLSGGFALTYMMTTPRRTLALRCFHREIPAAEQKYAAISRILGALGSPYFVGFEFVPDGIRIRGGFYPVLKMDWAEGETLGTWLDRFGGDRRALAQLREAFAALAAHLETNGIAHGDIQNGNVIVSPSGLKLVDYDGLYVPGMPVEFGCETGHKHFQHPQRTTAHFGPQVDRFSFIAVDLSVAALIEDPSLHRRFRQGGETILFRANDFSDPDHSAAFRCLEQHASLREAAANFAAICRAEIAAVPSLADFRAGRNIPPATARVPAASGAGAYIGPCPIVAAEDFAAVSRLVGQRVELVGQVHSVRAGNANGSRRCTYVDFAPPRGNGVEVAVWADSASGPHAAAPDQSWVGRWAGVVGLIDPPRAERGFWSNRTRVGIGTANPHEIELISEPEARFRLARGERDAPGVGVGQATRAGGVGNRRLVSRLLSGAGTATKSAKGLTAAPRPAAAPPGASWRPSRSNQTILGALRRGARTVAPAAAAAQPAAAPTPLRQAPNFIAPRQSASFVPPRATAAVAPVPANLTSRAPARSAPPKSGSFVIHPQNRRRRPAPARPAAAEPTPWQRVRTFLGIDG